MSHALPDCKFASVLSKLHGSCVVIIVSVREILLKQENPIDALIKYVIRAASSRLGVLNCPHGRRSS